MERALLEDHPDAVLRELQQRLRELQQRLHPLRDGLREALELTTSDLPAVGLERALRSVVEFIESFDDFRREALSLPLRRLGAALIAELKGNTSDPPLPVKHFLEAVHEARSTYDQENKRQGCVKAVVAAMELVEQLEPPDGKGFEQPFRSLLVGLLDLDAGAKTPELFRRKSSGGGRADPQDLLHVRAVAAQAVGFLIQVDTGDPETREERACRAVLAVLDHHKFPVQGRQPRQERKKGGHATKWEVIRNWRSNARSGKFGPHAEKLVKATELPAELPAGSSPNPNGVRHAVLQHFADVLRDLGWSPSILKK